MAKKDEDDLLDGLTDDAATDSSGDGPVDDEPVEEDRRGRFSRFARRLIDRKELAEDTREMLFTLWTTSDKAKSEMVRMVGREVRNYLDALELREILTGYSLEVKASLHLKPLDDEPVAAPEVSLKARPKDDGARAATKPKPKDEV